MLCSRRGSSSFARLVVRSRLTLPTVNVERSMAPITDEHLRRLAKFAKADREGLFSRKPHLAVYRDRILMTALCQGAALH